MCVKETFDRRKTDNDNWGGGVGGVYIRILSPYYLNFQ